MNVKKWRLAIAIRTYYTIRQKKEIKEKQLKADTAYILGVEKNI